MIGAVIGGGLLIIGAIVTLVGIERAASGKLKVNGLNGIRITSTMASRAAWQAGHAAAVKPTRVTVASCVACALVGLWVSPRNEWLAFGLILFGAFILVAGLLFATSRAATAAKAVTEHPQP